MMMLADWVQIHTHILQLEQEGIVTRTFRRLDPGRQRAVLSAIIEEAVAEGLPNVSIKRVAERAGTAVGSLYQYFGSRDGMLDFAIELSVRFTLEAFEAYRTVLVKLPLDEALAAYLSGGVAWGQAEAQLMQFFAKAAYQGEPGLNERLVRPVADKMRAIVYDMLAAAVERGEIPAHTDLETAVRLIHMLTIGIGDAQLLPYLNTYFQAVDKDMPPERITAAMVRFVLRGLQGAGWA